MVVCFVCFLIIGREWGVLVVLLHGTLSPVLCIQVQLDILKRTK